MHYKHSVINQSFLLALAALLFGFFAFSASLISASQEELGSSPSASSKKMYLSTELLPDHLLYPFLMASDKVLLTVTPSSQKKVFLYLDLAADRRMRAEKLLEKQEYLLVISTLTKSQKYLLRAAAEAFSLNESQHSAELWQRLSSDLLYNQQQFKLIKANLQTQETSALDTLSAEIDALLPAIQSRY